MDPNQEVFNRVAEYYDHYRPSPPETLPDLLIELCQVDLPSLVVDLGCGTGLSTLIWAGKAKTIIGIEPNADMLAVAQKKAKAVLDPDQALVFQAGTASATHLPEHSADIVTCAQSFHWMEPDSTLAEIERILRPGGIFAAYDYQWPPTVNWRAEMAFDTFIERAWAIKEQRGLEQNLRLWPENRELSQLQTAGHFRYTKELWMHRQERGNANRFVGLALTNGLIQYLQAGQLNADEIQLKEFEQSVRETIGDQPIPWYFSYHIRIGVL